MQKPPVQQSRRAMGPVMANSRVVSQEDPESEKGNHLFFHFRPFLFLQCFQSVVKLSLMTPGLPRNIFFSLKPYSNLLDLHQVGQVPCHDVKPLQLMFPLVLPTC